MVSTKKSYKGNEIIDEEVCEWQDYQNEIGKGQRCKYIDY